MIGSRQDGEHNFGAHDHGITAGEINFHGAIRLVLNPKAEPKAHVEGHGRPCGHPQSSMREIINATVSHCFVIPQRE